LRPLSMTALFRPMSQIMLTIKNSAPTLASRSTELLLILFGHRRHDSRIHLRIFYPCVVVGLVAWCHHSTAASRGMALAAVARSQLCVTEGAIEQSGAERHWSVSTPKMRAYVNNLTEPVVEARFRYLGPTSNEVPLGSGALRRQFGLKLRAQDACNLVYAMWRIEPESKLVVSVKS